LVADVNLIASGLPAILALLQQLPASQQPSAGVMAQIQKAMADLQANAAQVGTVLAPNQPAISQVASIVNLIASLATPFFPAAALIGPIVQAAITLVPVIFAAVGKAPPAAVAQKAAAAHMTPDAARLVLKSAGTQ
jgi:hypothetical protein